MNIICGIKNNETLDGVTQAQVMEMNKLNDSQCNRPCPGNPYQICGGDQDPNSGTSGKISVYQLGDEIPVHVEVTVKGSSKVDRVSRSCDVTKPILI